MTKDELESFALYEEINFSFNFLMQSD